MIDGYDTGTLVGGTIYYAATTGLMLAWGWRAPLVDRWAASRGVQLTDETRPYVTRRLRTARRWRTIGVAVGWLSPYIWMWIQRSAYASFPWIFHAMLSGYVLGALGAELDAARRMPRGSGAVLARRDAHQYVAGPLFDWCARAAVASAIVATAIHLVPIRQVTVASSVMSPRPQAVLAGIALALLLAAHALPSLIVSRRQPYLGDDLTRADDALRSWSATTCVGTVLTALLLIVSTQLLHLAYWSEWTWLRWATGLAAVAAASAAIGTIQVTSGPDWRWRVRREGVAGGPSPS